MLALLAAVGTAVAMQPAAAVAGSSTGGNAAGMHPYSSSLTKADIARLSRNASHRVIVIMRDQHSSLNPGLAHLAARARAVQRTESSVLHELSALHSRNVHGYKMIAAVSGVVSKAEIARLKSNPAVQAVIADRPVQRPDAQPTVSKGSTTSTAAAAGTVVKANNVPGVCPTDPSKPLLPEALTVMNATAANRIATGAGVKVAVFPDGVDPTITDFRRPGTNTPVIFDYRDFSGEGTNAATGGAEAFGDVSSIAAQGRVTYDLSKQVDDRVPLPANCNIRIKGVAPGAAVAVMKVFGENTIPFNSEILQGLDYAVNTDHVNILSESFGGNPLPDNGRQDPIALFNTQATKNGVTVVVSTGDAGTTNTIGTPATAPGVISAAATTTYQVYAQTSTYGAYKGDQNGWERNNIAPISSSGITNAAHTADVAAPGDGNWVDCSPNTAIYTECGPLWPQTTAWQPITTFGGTSESCPLTSATAALVIQAYRGTHGGAFPTPAQVKQIITSSATDLNTPGENQGAGLVNALRAVQMAQSIPGSGKTPAHHGQSLLLSRNQVSHTGAAGSSFSFTDTVRNLGTTSHTVAPVLTRFGSGKTLKTGSVDIENTDPQLLFLAQAGTSGYTVPYQTTTFSVPTGYNRLIFRLAWDGSVGAGIVRATLFDPKGRIEANSRPQGGNGGFGEIEARNPIAGTWKVVFFPTGTSNTFTGTVHYSVAVQKRLTVAGAVSPAGSVTLGPGQAKTFTVTSHLPASGGDAVQTLRFGSLAGAVPVVERALLAPAVGHAAAFSTTITGGNARPSLYGVSKFWQFNVPQGVKDVDVNMSIAHAGYTLIGFLIDPHGEPLDVTSSLYADQTQPTLPVSNLQTMNLTWAKPEAGRWTFVLAVTQGQTSALTSTGLHGTVGFNQVHITQAGLPTSTSTLITAGTSRTATIHVSNAGNSPEAYYVDPRMTQNTTIQPFDDGTTSGNLPITFSDSLSQFFVPPFSSSLTIAAQSGGPSPPPIDFDTSPAFGSPDDLSSRGTSAVVTVSHSDLPSSEYICAPVIDQAGGFGQAATTGGSYTCGASVVTKAFDQFTTSSTGDLWTNGSFTPLVLQPGQSGDITVRITAPNGVGQGFSVTGFLPVLTWNPVTVSGDSLVAFPYAYSFGH